MAPSTFREEAVATGAARPMRTQAAEPAAVGAVAGLCTSLPTPTPEGAEPKSCWAAAPEAPARETAPAAVLVLPRKAQTGSCSTTILRPARSMRAESLGDGRHPLRPRRRPRARSEGQPASQAVKPDRPGQAVLPAPLC